MWRLVAQIAIANQWTWIDPIEGEWFRFEFVDPPGEVRVDITQGNGSAPFATPTRVTTSESQIVRFRTFPSTMGDRRLAIRSGDRFFRNYNLGWLVKISVFEGAIEIDGNDYSSALQSLLNGQQEILQQLEAGGIDQAIASNIQALTTGQAQILQRLQQPITARVDPALSVNIQTLLTAQAEILALVQEPSLIAGSIVSSLQTLLAGQSQILQQFPTVQPDPALNSGIRQILQILQPQPIVNLNPVTATFSISQSSAYNSVIGTTANLSDGNGATGAGTNANTIEWIQATFATPIEISGIRVGGGNINGWGGVAAYLNNRQIQWSVDGASWGVLATIIRVEDSGPNQFIFFGFPKVTARFFRIASNGYLSTTEFRFFN